MHRLPRMRRSFRPLLHGPLEDRIVLAGNPHFAVIEGILPADGAGAEVTIRLIPEEFTIHRERVILTITSTDGADEPLDVSPTRRESGGFTPYQRALADGGRLTSLRHGTYTFRVGRGIAGGGAFTVHIALTGDVDGDGAVDRADLQSIHSAIRHPGADPQQDARLHDLDGSGHVGAHDLELALRNRRDATTVTALTLILSAQQPNPTAHLIGVQGMTQAGAQVTLGQTGRADQQATASSAGQTRFSSLVPFGTTTLSGVATDTFGQRVTASLPVARATPSSFLGAAFEPYVKQWVTTTAPDAQVPPFNSYGTGNASAANQIALIAPTFPQIATYGAGYAPYYPPGTPWNEVDSNWMNAPSSAAYNAAQGMHAVTVSQGIYQQVIAGTIANASQQAETSGAFQAAANANATYAGTVTRLIFTNEYVTDAATTDQVNALVTANKAAAHAALLEVGVRSNTFGQLLNPSSSYLTQLQTLVQNLDFIMCNIYPSQQATEQGIAASVAEVANQYNLIKAAAVALNPAIEVLIGETGWPSQGISFNDPTGTHNTLANAQAYYEAMRTWANTNQVQVMYFEAIDEPWKSNQNNTNPADPQGYQGAEGHYGIWTYTTSDNSGSFVAKWTP